MADRDYSEVDVEVLLESICNEAPFIKTSELTVGLKYQVTFVSKLSTNYGLRLCADITNTNTHSKHRCWLPSYLQPIESKLDQLNNRIAAGKLCYLTYLGPEVQGRSVLVRFEKQSAKPSLKQNDSFKGTSSYGYV